MNLRDRLQRVRTNLSPSDLGRLVQAAVAAGISWELALQLPNHGQPFFAPIAAAIPSAPSAAGGAGRRSR